MITRGLQLTAVFVVAWMLPVSLAVLVSLAAGGTNRALRTALRLLIIAYLLAAVALNLWPFDFDLSLIRVLDEGNFVPFDGSLRFLVADASERAYLRHDFLHVVLLIPVGLLLPLQQRWRRLWVVVVSALFVVALAFVIEVTQGVTVVGRAFDVDDAIAGAVGALAAVGLGAVVRLVVER